MAAVSSAQNVMSGMGARASASTPYIVMETSPATAAASAPKSRHAIQNVLRTTPRAARSEGTAALAWVTAAPGQDARAMSQASRGGLSRCGTPFRRGRIQCPCVRMSRASKGNLASSFVVNILDPKSKERRERLVTSTSSSRLVSAGWRRDGGRAPPPRSRDDISR